MGLEVATTIAGLNSANPLSSDQKNQGDDHLRLIKAVLLADAMGLSTVHAGASKATPVDADEIPIVDSLALTTIKKLTWANLKATLKTYNDTLYATSGANSSITSLSGLTTPLSVAQGGTGNTTGGAVSAGIPQNSQSVAYTTVLTDANKHILHPTADNNPRTFTIAANASVAYPIGTTLTFVNQINTLTIAINTDTLVLAGIGSTGSRTLNSSGMATALKVEATKWVISGSGLS